MSKSAVEECSLRYDAAAERFESADVGSANVNVAIRSPIVYVENWVKRTATKDQVFLEVGCGSGYFSMFLAQHAKVFGIDISEKSIEFAKRRATGDSQFSVADVQRLSFSDSMFDLVVSLGNLSYVDKEKALREMSRVLKPNGAIFIVDTLGNNPILNLNRRVKTALKLKPKMFLNTVLKVDDFALFQRNFRHVEINYFDLLTVFLIPLGWMGRFQVVSGAVVNVAAKLDQLLFKIPFLRKFAFKVVIQLKNPIYEN